MADNPIGDHRLASLRHRWEQDPSSRLFVQLAEAHRRRGEVTEALEVLDRGLTFHPNYLSAKIVRARCQLELGRAGEAREELESVVSRDPTHLVAGQLLVETHLQLGDRSRALEALERYRLLGAGGDEFDELERRATGFEQAEAASALDLLVPGPEPAVVPVEASETSRDAPKEPERVEAAEPPPREPLRAVAGAPFDLPPSPEPRWAPLLGEESRVLVRWGASSPFGGSTQIPSGRIAGQLFEEAPQPAASPIALEHPVATLPEPAGASESEPEPKPDRAEAADLSDAEPIVSATLGELYLRQGHHSEALAVFEQVLERDPEDSAALRGLDQLRELSTADSDPDEEPGSVAELSAAEAPTDVEEASEDTTTVLPGEFVPTSPTLEEGEEAPMDTVPHDDVDLPAPSSEPEELAVVELEESPQDPEELTAEEADGDEVAVAEPASAMELDPDHSPAHDEAGADSEQGAVEPLASEPLALEPLEELAAAPELSEDVESEASVATERWEDAGSSEAAPAEPGDSEAVEPEPPAVEPQLVAIEPELAGDEEPAEETALPADFEEAPPMETTTEPAVEPVVAAPALPGEFPRDLTALELMGDESVATRGLTARKLHLLKQYLTRITRKGE